MRSGSPDAERPPIRRRLSERQNSLSRGSAPRLADLGRRFGREMRDNMIVSAPLFVAASLWLAPSFGNHGLWAAFMLYFLLRAATLAFYLPRIRGGFGTA